MRKLMRPYRQGTPWVILFTMGLLASACHCRENPHHSNTTGSPNSPTQISATTPRPLNKADIPADCHFIGTVVKALSWSDSQGDNIAVLTATTARPFVSDEYPKEAEALEKELHVYHYVRNSTSLHLLSHFNVQNIAVCNDRIIDFHEPSVRVTDVDKDGEAELSFMYVDHSICDVRDVEVKLLLQRKGARYTISGYTRIFVERPVEYSPSFRTAPREVATFMHEQWERFIPEIGAEIACAFGYVGHKDEPPHSYDLDELLSPK